MREEAAVPIAQRFLMVASRLSDRSIRRLDSIKVPKKVRECRDRLDEDIREAVENYLARTSHPATTHLVLISVYADMPLSKEYDLVFRLEPPNDPEPTRAILRHVVFWDLPVNQLVDGHHQIGVFEFPDGMPRLIEELAIEREDGRSMTELGLCVQQDWTQILETGPNPSWQDKEATDDLADQPLID